MFKRFTKDYNVVRLVHFEFFESMIKAIKREKTLKNGIVNGSLRL
jgi:predicted GIY-YIG superfamily endonuclease